MKSTFPTGARFFIISFAIVMFMTVSAGAAKADTVTIHVITLGSFNPGVFSSNPSLSGLSFNGTSFPNPIGTVDTNTAAFALAGPTINLGSLALIGAPATYTGNTFALQLTFTFLSAPILLTGDSQPSFTAALIGTVQSSVSGSVTVDFSQAVSVFNVFLNDILIGRFSVSIDDIVIQPGQTVNIVGTVTPQGVPEPMTLLLFGAGLAGVGTAVRKRLIR